MAATTTTSYTQAAPTLLFSLVSLFLFASLIRSQSIVVSDRNLQQFPLVAVHKSNTDGLSPSSSVAAIHKNSDDNSLHPLDSSRLRESIILFGDSITESSFGTTTANGQHHEGFGTKLSKDYTRRADVLDRGFSGYTTKLAVDELLPRVFTSSNDTKDEHQHQQPVLFVTVMFGTDDILSKQMNIKDYGQNLNSIVEHIQGTLGADTPIVVLAPPPMAPSLRSKSRQHHLRKVHDNPDVESLSSSHAVVSENLNMRARAYGFKARQVAQQHNLGFVDTWLLLEGMKDESEFGPQYLYLDGVHPNEQGDHLIFNGIMDALKKRYPEVLPAVAAADGGGTNYGTARGIPMEAE